MNFAATLRIALLALRVNKMRSALTMLGIIIGVAAVIVMIAVGGGAQARVEVRASRLKCWKTKPSLRLRRWASSSPDSRETSSPSSQ